MNDSPQALAQYTLSLVRPYHPLLCFTQKSAKTVADCFDIDCFDEQSDTTLAMLTYLVSGA